MMAVDDAARIRQACGSLGQLDAFAIGGSARTILVACMEIGACYAVNLWCDAPELANEIEAFLTTREITSHRTWESFSGGISVGYTVNKVLDAASTVMKIAKILKIPPNPGRARQLIQMNRDCRLDTRLVLDRSASCITFVDYEKRAISKARNEQNFERAPGI